MCCSVLPRAKKIRIKWTPSIQTFFFSFFYVDEKNQSTTMNTTQHRRSYAKENEDKNKQEFSDEKRHVV